MLNRKQVISLSSKKVTIQKGKKKKVSVKNAKGRKIKWSIKKKSIASVKKKGKYAVTITGKKEGKTTLICKVKNGSKWKTLSCKVTVQKKKAENKDNTSLSSTTTSPAGTTAATVSPSASPSPSPTASVSPGNGTDFSPVEYKKAGFESSTDGFESRGGAKLSVVSGGHAGNALSVTGRTDKWHGAALNVTSTIVKGASYKFSACVKQETGEDKAIKMSIQLTAGSANPTFPEIAQLTCKSGEWTYIEGNYTIPTSFDELIFYLEGPGGTYDFLVDDLTITQTTEGAEIFDPMTLPSLKDAYAGTFERFGNVLSYNTSWNNGYQLQNANTMAFVKKQFNSYTLENEMKPGQLILDWSDTTISVSEAKQLGYVIPENYEESIVVKINFDNLDKIL